MLHLTHTGIFAGALLCGSARDKNGQYAHAVYAPLDNPKYRAQCCSVCLEEYALSAYEDSDDMPAWVQYMRAWG